MINKHISNVDVVTMARQRIKNIFELAREIVLTVSGGKDSICLNDLVFTMCQSGEIDKSKLKVYFIDEEAIYPCVERIVNSIRLQWLTIGVEFVWWCIQVKHFNCFNQLTNDESFICWDETKKDVWIRPKPKFAKTSHPLLEERIDTYQNFLAKLCSKQVTLTGVRISESIHRMYNIARKKDQSKLEPIYDWKDTDVWNYIREYNLDFPEAYLYMYQVGIPINKLRISQFFSIDTAGSLVRMCEYYPQLFDKICKREPNAYLAMLYYDTELFRRDKKQGKSGSREQIDYKKKTIEVLKESWRFESEQGKDIEQRVKNIIVRFSLYMTNKDYKDLYQTILAGDPKARSLRAIGMRIFSKIRSVE